MSKINQMRAHLEQQRVNLYAMFKPTTYEFTNPETGQLMVVDFPSTMPAALFAEIDTNLAEALRRLDAMERSHSVYPGSLP